LGFDLHPLAPANVLIIGGVEIPYHLGSVGHSDGDVLCHAVTDALLGACGLGNIGELFPDSDARFKGMSSLKFVEAAGNAVRGALHSPRTDVADWPIASIRSEPVMS
jgi:2-C-methyl-D-erythritol 2,4-cyclodiphosphate synthase